MMMMLIIMGIAIPVMLIAALATKMFIEATLYGVCYYIIKDKMSSEEMFDLYGEKIESISWIGLFTLMMIVLVSMC